jgi:signal transduction histidine kinase
MERTELIIFIVLSSITLAIFIIAVILFFYQWRRRKLSFDREKSEAERLYQEQLLQTRLDSRQQTMQFIGQEIHDSVGQRLTLASIYAKQMEPMVPGNQVNKLKEVAGIIDESLSELRMLSRSLASPELAEASLQAMLELEAKRVNATGLCQLVLQLDQQRLGLDPLKKHQLLRILQEFVQNSLRHSGCRVIRVDLYKKDHLMELVARDDGKGFEVSSQAQGVGLYNMERRAAEIGAKYQISSIPGTGTTLKLEIDDISGSRGG